MMHIGSVAATLDDVTEDVIVWVALRVVDGEEEEEEE